MDFTQYNTSQRFELDGYRWVKAIDMVGKTMVVNGFFITTDKFNNNQVVLINKDEKIMVSTSSNVDVFKSFKENIECMKAIYNNECGVKFYKYHSKKFNRECVSIEFVNVLPF